MIQPAWVQHSLAQRGEAGTVTGDSSVPWGWQCHRVGSRCSLGQQCSSFLQRVLQLCHPRGPCPAPPAQPVCPFCHPGPGLAGSPGHPSLLPRGSVWQGKGGQGQAWKQGQTQVAADPALCPCPPLSPALYATWYRL